MCDICKLIHINYDKFSKIFIENDGSAPYYIEDPFDEAYDTRGGWTHQESIKFVRKKWQDSDVERYWKNISVLLKAEIIVKKGLRKRYLDSICTTLEQNFCVKVLDQSIKFYQKEMGNLSEEKEGLEISIVNQRSRDTFDNVDVEFIDSFEIAGPFRVEVDVESRKLYSPHSGHLNHNSEIDKDILKYLRKSLGE